MRKNKFFNGKKKKILGFAAGILALCMTGSLVYGAGETVDMESADSQEQMVKSYLTGEDVPESVGRRRPVAVMLGNNIEGAPQSGTTHAGVIYEAPVEGGITRLMGIFEDYDSLEKIGSVRSCRDYYIFYANEFDAIYAHYGQAAYALQYLDNGVIDNLNGLVLGGTAFYRTSDRQAPHNAYTSAEYLQRGIDAKGYRQTYKDGYTGHYQFSDTEVIPDSDCTANIVHMDNFSDNHPWFEYNADTKKYSRFQYGQAHIDETTGEQLTCDNIILQYSNYQPYDANGYLNIDTSSGGQGKYITRGKAMDITWSKDDASGITHYYDTAGQEISLNPGKTWVEIVLNDSLDGVTFQ